MRHVVLGVFAAAVLFDLPLVFRNGQGFLLFVGWVLFLVVIEQARALQKGGSFRPSSGSGGV